MGKARKKKSQKVRAAEAKKRVKNRRMDTSKYKEELERNNLRYSLQKTGLESKSQDVISQEGLCNLSTDKRSIRVSLIKKKKSQRMKSQKTKKRNKLRRLNEQKYEVEKERNKLRMRAIRESNKIAVMQANWQNKLRMKRNRANRAIRSIQNKKKKVANRLIRINPDFRENERKKDAEAKKKRRSSPRHYSLIKWENRRRIKFKRIRDEQFRLKGRVTHAIHMRNLRAQAIRNKIERTTRQVKSLTTNEPELPIRHRTIHEKSQTNLKRRLRKNLAERRKLMDKLRKENLRQNPILAFRDNFANALRREDTPQARAQLLFIKERAQIADCVCTCCEGLFFRHGVVTKKKIMNCKLRELDPNEFDENILNTESQFVCITCERHLLKGNIPKLATSQGLKFPVLPDFIRNMSPLEERAVSPIINFMRIQALKPFALNPQLGLRGSVVNIPIEIADVVSCLPRAFDNMSTLQLKLKRALDHKRDYMYETVRPAVICQALEFLLESDLYKKHEITIDQEIFDRYRKSVENEIDFIVNQEDAERSQGAVDPEALLADIDFDQWENDEVMLIDQNEEEINKQIAIVAPGEGKKPVAWHKYEDIHELSFPRIFGGVPFNTNEPPVSITQRIKSELRNQDRRSCEPTRVLYLAKLKMEQLLFNNIQICLRKSAQVKATEIKTATDKSAFVKNLIAADDGYGILRNIRPSPAYWSTKKKEILAMARQLGRPTFFLTLSMAETQWAELLQTLYKLQKGKYISLKEALELDNNTKTELVRNDPITCARYFDNKVKKIMKNLRNPKSGIFGDFHVVDFYIRVEFQLRGSPHVHIVLWCDNAPEFEHAESDELLEFIDDHISCARDDNNPYIKNQIHRHSHTCKRKNGCRFNIPFPVMQTTRILTPLSEEEETERAVGLKNYEAIKKLMEEFYKNPVKISFNEVLEKLDGMDASTYIFAIRSQLKRPKIYLRRNSYEVAVNCYNPTILKLFESNMDLQFVLDEYALANYIVNYISKPESGVAKVLRESLGNLENVTSLFQQYAKISSSFLNASLMSAQEAAYYNLSMSFSQSSRKVVYIDTQPSDKRVRMLKSLKEIKPDDTEIFIPNVFEKYSERDVDDENMCLADFVANYNQTKGEKAEFDQDDGENLDIDPEDGREFDEIMAAATVTTATIRKKRGKPKIIRYRKYNLRKDETNYYREKCLLFLPWRNEVEDIEQKDINKLYSEHFSKIFGNERKYVKLDEQQMQFLEEDLANAEMIEGCSVNDDSTQGKGKRKAPKTVENEDDLDFDVNILDQVDEKKKREKGDSKSYFVPERIPEDTMLEKLQRLNEKQKEFVMHVLHCVKTGTNLPIHAFLSGGAGAGKSELINCLYQVLTRHFDNIPGGDKDMLSVLLCAFTGKAAFLINGTTLHGAFKLPLNEYGGVMRPLSDDEGNTVRTTLAKLKVLIIDEISMVGPRTFTNIDSRLKAIFGKKEDFGGLSVIVVGDLNQLPPVKDCAIYKIPNSKNVANLNAFAGTHLWNLFKYYELTQIMRQKDEIDFIMALKNLTTSIMTEADIKLIKSREVKKGDVPDDVIRLFPDNESVDRFNDMRIKNAPGELFKSEAADFIGGKIKKGQKTSILKSLKKKKPADTAGMPSTLLLKVGIKYMVTNNMSVEDGLVNGACGILRWIHFENDHPKVLFLDFKSDKVGKKARLPFMKMMEENNGPDNLHCVPIEKITRSLYLNNWQAHDITRQQFPLVIAEAMTIHKSQGSTFESVCVDLSKRMSRQQLYVALSRVTSLDRLFILGEFKQPNPPSETDPLQVELNKLRTVRRLNLSFNNLKSKTGTIIAYQNIRSFNKYSNHIEADPWYARSDILILSETQSLPHDRMELKGFQQFFRSDNEAVRRASGVVLFSKTSTLPNILQHIKKDSGNAKTRFELDLILFEVNGTYVITGYKSPQTPTSLFQSNVNELFDVVESLNESAFKCVLIGDFNFNVIEKNILQQILAPFNLQTRLPVDEMTTPNYTQIDVVFSNFTEMIAGVYETYFSDHKPIFCMLNELGFDLNISPNVFCDSTQPIQSSNSPDLLLQSIFTETREEDDSDKITKRPLEKNVSDSDSEEIKKKIRLSQVRREKRKSIELLDDDIVILSDEIEIDGEKRNKKKKKKREIDRSRPIDRGINKLQGLERIRGRRRYLDDNAMDLFCNLVNRNHHEFQMLTILSAQRKEYYWDNPIVDRDDVQILFLGTAGVTGHFICIYYDSSSKTLYAYDPLNKKGYLGDYKEVIEKRYRISNLEHIVFAEPATLQPDAYSCGVFACAYATTLILGFDPVNYKLRLDDSLPDSTIPLREHLVQIIENERLEPFPQP